MTYEEAKEMALSMPEIANRGSQYVEEFVQGFLQAMNEGDIPSPLTEQKELKNEN